MEQDLFSAAGVSAGPVTMTLAQFAKSIGDVIRRVPQLQSAWVAAELSDLRYNGGHCYMELIEKNERGETVARMRANIWAGSLRLVRGKFMAVTGRDLCSGIKVMLYGAASFHNVYGLSFNVGDIDPAYTLGDMERIRREILERLAREGIIAANREVMPPVAPQRIAVISAAGAAGYGDFINQIAGNAEGFVVYPVLFGAVMQGERTASGICAALDRIEASARMWDCVVIIRGGGATSDLNGFDNYELARRVALCPLPVVVGIGHERDRTVLDEIASVRCKTPTAVAAWVVDSLRQAWNRAGSLTNTIARHTADRLSGERRRLDNAEAMVPAMASQRILRAQSLLQSVMSHLPAIASARTARARGVLDLRAELLRESAARQSRAASRHLDELVAAVSATSTEKVSRASVQLESLGKLVAVLNPENTLRRGYSVTRVGGHAVTDASALPPGTIIETTLLGGKIISTVNEK